MSKTNSEDAAGRRTYRLKKRARQQEETRERIVEALVELHGTVGPAKTTITDVAEMAGVGRMTVYNHFPVEADLFRACSSHWFERNLPPDPASWADIRDADKRLVTTLAEIYDYYRRTAPMMGNVLRDAPQIPALAGVLQAAWSPYMDAVLSTLFAGRNLRGNSRKRFGAAVRLVLDFSTWRTLTDSGLDTSATVELATDMVRGAAAPRKKSRR